MNSLPESDLKGAKASTVPDVLLQGVEPAPTEVPPPILGTQRAPWKPNPTSSGCDILSQQKNSISTHRGEQPFRKNLLPQVSPQPPT